MMKKYCTKCGREFYAIGREVICPSCKAQAAADAKHAAVLKAKRASWAGESVPVRISGRASTVIRKYGEANSLPFAESLDALLKSTAFFEKLGVEWSTIEPYRSRRRDKQDTAQEVKDVPQDAPQDVKTAAKTTSKASASKASASKAASSKASKAKK